MSEMVERGADALIAKFKAEVALSAGIPFEQTKVSVPDRSIWLGYSRAMLEAMREPTKAMLDAVEAEEIKQGYCFAAFETIGCKDSWPIMIDEALK